jgi:signal transduction histidine kinase
LRSRPPQPPGRGLAPLLGNRRTLEARLVASYVAVSVLITLTSLVGGRLIQWNAERERTRFGGFLQETESLLSLAGSISEEGFSYIVSGDESEAESTLTKLNEFQAQTSALRNLAAAGEREAHELDEVTSQSTHLRDAALGMFGEFRVEHRISKDAYEGYDGAVDRLSVAITRLRGEVSRELDARVRRAQTIADWLTVAAGLASVLMGVALGRSIGRRITRPIVALRDAAIAFGRGRSDSAVPVTSHDEVGDLTIAFNTMTTERGRQELALRQAHKMDAVGRLASGIAHDFNNMLSIILGYATFLLDGRGESDPLYGPLSEMKVAGERSADLTRQLLSFSRQRTLEVARVDLDLALRATVKMVARVLPPDVRIVFEGSPAPCSVGAEAGQIEQLVMNLIINARDAMPRGGDITITAEPVEIEDGRPPRRSLPPGRYTKLCVADEGTGMDPATLERIFEPFFTTKEQGKGTGLGLSTVFGIVQQCKGAIFAESEVGHGTTFTAYLPELPERFDAPASDLASDLASDERGISEPKESVFLVEKREPVRVVTASSPPGGAEHV